MPIRDLMRISVNAVCERITRFLSVVGNTSWTMVKPPIVDSARMGFISRPRSPRVMMTFCLVMLCTWTVPLCGFELGYRLRRSRLSNWGSRRYLPSTKAMVSPGLVRLPTSMWKINRKRLVPQLKGQQQGDEDKSSGNAKWRKLNSERENVLCEQVLETRRVQELQVEVERMEGRPVSVHEWAIAAGYPSYHQLLEAMQEGRKAERSLVQFHQSLVRNVARKYASLTRSLSMGDLVQEGNVGLMQAIGCFNPNKGTRFSSYAVFRIKASILRAIADKDRVVRVPVHVQDMAMRVVATSNELLRATGETPTDAQLALALSIPEETVSKCRTIVSWEDVGQQEEGGKDAVLAESGLGNQDETLLLDVGGRGNQNMASWAQEHMMKEDILRMIMVNLSPTEGRALRLRFGFEGTGGSSLTFKEIGHMMEVSAEGIRKMIFRSLWKLQASDEAAGLLLAYLDLIV